MRRPILQLSNPNFSFGIPIRDFPQTGLHYGWPGARLPQVRYYMDAALHPGSRILDGSPTRRRGGDHRGLTAVSAAINPYRHQQIAAVPVTASALEPDTWTRR